MAEIKTTQAELDAIFKRMERDYLRFNKRQQEYAVKEIARIKGDIALFLSEYADDKGTVEKRRMTRLLRDLDAIEDSLRKYGEQALEDIIDNTAEWTTRRVTQAVGASITASQFDRINRHVVKYVVKRFGDDGLVLSERIWGLSGEIRDDLATVLRTGIIKGESVSTMIPKLRKVYDNETWKIHRLARNESTVAHRAAISYNAQNSNIVKWVQFHHGDKRTDACVTLANEDRYGKGRGIYKPTDTDIWMPHVNCTGYITYVLDDI